MPASRLSVVPAVVATSSSSSSSSSRSGTHQIDLSRRTPRSYADERGTIALDELARLTPILDAGDDPESA
jgi:hypothetical protein